MADTPDVARIAALIGDRARATILTGLCGNQALTATELARASGITKQTASAHLSRLLEGGLVVAESQGRHRYFRLSDPDVAEVLEDLMGLASRVGAVKVETGPAEPALRRARVCYDHLAGELGVMVFEGLMRQRLLRADDSRLVLTEAGARIFEDLGIDVAELEKERRPMGLACLDWSVRRHHLAGALGAALLERCFALHWARRPRDSRAIHFSAIGERALRHRFNLY